MPARPAVQTSLDLANVAGDAERRPILVIDFDGVLHSYVSGWKGIDQIPDPPVPGFAEFLEGAVKVFDVAVFSSRSAEFAGRTAMREWLAAQLAKYYEATMTTAAAVGRATDLRRKIAFPGQKPAAFISLDDRALTFNGVWPDIAALRRFRPWWQKENP